MATQTDVIERAVYQASLLPKVQQGALQEAVLRHLIEECATTLKVTIDAEACLEVVQSRLTSALSVEPRLLYSPLAQTSNRYPKIDAQTEAMIWKIQAQIQEDLLHLFDYQVVASMQEAELGAEIQKALPGIMKRHNITLNQREFDGLMSDHG